MERQPQGGLVPIQNIISPPMASLHHQHKVLASSTELHHSRTPRFPLVSQASSMPLSERHPLPLPLPPPLPPAPLPPTLMIRWKVEPLYP